MKITISNGHNKFILAPLGSKIAKNGLQVRLITGAYPKKCLQHFSAFKFGGAYRERFFSRREEFLSDDQIAAAWLSEITLQVGLFGRRLGLRKRFFEKIYHLALLQYCHFAKKIVSLDQPTIFHYRSGYGGAAVAVAKKHGAITICDHSIVNPEVIDEMISKRGSWPEKPSSVVSPLERDLIMDLFSADYIIVNSDFVKDSFVRYGWDKERIYVAYTGLDDGLLKIAGIEGSRETAKRPQLLYAGELSQRKAVDVLFETAFTLRDENMDFTIVGDFEPESRLMKEKFQSIKNVKLLGNVSRNRLLEIMKNSDIFAFPTYAEGSARVIFMALAAGCFVITTPNAGSVVKDVPLGVLVSPGDAESFVAEIKKAFDNLEEIRDQKKVVQQTVLKEYTYDRYVTEILRIYSEVSLKASPRTSCKTR